MDSLSKSPLRRIRSFVLREGRFTKAQRLALEKLAPKYCIQVKNDFINFNEFFNKEQPIVLDIGFGSGESLLAIAQQRTDINFIGVEVYRPGIGSLLQRLEEFDINNVRVINADVLEVMRDNVYSNSMAGILVWFPDPWPKKKHHKRRLVQANFLQQAIRIIKTDGILHFASDWQPYVEAVTHEALEFDALNVEDTNVNPLLEMNRPSTRFERRGLQLNHKVTDLYYRITK